MGSKQRATVYVTIVASRAETLDGLQTYLSLAGLCARGTRRLDDFWRERCTAVVLFPDEFSLKDVVRELGRLRREQPRVLSLLITCEPRRYVESVVAKVPGLAPIVIPKPAWGSTILDAIREARPVRRTELSRAVDRAAASPADSQPLTPEQSATELVPPILRHIRRTLGSSRSTRISR